MCNFVRGHNRYLVSAQQETAGRRDFLAREGEQILQNNMKEKNVRGFFLISTLVYRKYWKAINFILWITHGDQNPLLLTNLCMQIEN